MAPNLLDLYLAFQRIALHAFGGVLPWARRELVERRSWLSDEEFTEQLGLCQFLPGPNVGNLAVAVGSRFHGVAGAAAAFLGLYILPVAIVLVLGGVYARYRALPTLSGALDGIAAVAAGLIAAMAIKMARPLLRRKRKPWHAPVFVMLTFGAVGALRLPLVWAMPLLAAASILLAPDEA